MNRRAFLAGATSLTAASLAGCTSLLNTPSDPSQGEFDVGMSSSAFHPRELEVSTGTPVVWKNTGARLHTVTAYERGIPDDADYFASGGYDSQKAAVNAWFDGGNGAIDQGTTYELTFDVPGTYNYFCIPHEAKGMTGKVVVTDE